MRQIEKFHEQGEYANLDSERVRVFKAGLSMDMRHEIQAGLKQGNIQLVFTTNALELGIDVGGLDGVILAGFPDSMMSAWQRIGRAGRNWNATAFVLYYARNNPLDQFYASNLEVFLEKPLDDLVVNPENEDLIERHVPCLVFEMSDLDCGKNVLGDQFYRTVAKKLAAGYKSVRSGGYRPHNSVDIRGSGKGMYKLEYGSEDVGMISGHQQFREAYQRAIYMHGGSTYRVEEIAVTRSGGTIKLGKADPSLRTKPGLYTTLSEQDVYAGRQWVSESAVIEVMYGKVTVAEMISSIEEVNEHSGEVIDRWVPEFNSAQYSDAHACWIEQESLPQEMLEGIETLQHLLRVGVLFSIPVDAHDILSYAKGRKIYVVESYPGGIGITRKVLEKWREVLEVGIRVADSCQCSKGCPNCILQSRSQEGLDKKMGISVARSLLAVTQDDHSFEFVEGFWKPV